MQSRGHGYLLTLTIQGESETHAVGGTGDNQQRAVLELVRGLGARGRAKGLLGEGCAHPWSQGYGKRQSCF